MQEGRVGWVENAILLKRSFKVVETLIEIIRKSLESNDVLICGFVKFCVKEKNERKGRNPATGGTMMLRPRKVGFSVLVC